MIAVARDVLSLGQTKKYGLNLNDYLTAPDGTTTSISGTPAVNGLNCTVTYNTNASGYVYITVVAGTNLAKGARGAAQVTTTLANGEVVPLQIDLDFA